MNKAVERGRLVLELSQEGLSNREIAARLGVSRDTVLVAKRAVRADGKSGDPA